MQTIFWTAPCAVASAKRFGGALAALAAALLVSACGPVGGIGGTAPTPEAPLSAPTQPVQSQPIQGGGATANQIGSGPVRIALIVPLTQGSGASVVGTSLRNAAQLGFETFGGNDVTILVKDDNSSPAGARAAAQAAIAEGAELIIGPLHAASVREAGSAARAANRPVIAFSTDTSVASRGVYLLSFLVESYVDRIVDFAAARGKKSMAALIPAGDYGRIAEAAFQAAAANKGIRVVAIENYSAGGAAGAVQKLAAQRDQIDALFIPEQADAMGAVSQALTANGFDPKRVQILGTGIWSDARVLKLPALQGAWYAAPENNGFNAFATKYRAKFGADPVRLATLAYDATMLAAALARQQGSQRFAEGVLTNRDGINGADGLFRFRADGQNERGLSVLQIGNGTTTVVSPAPTRFSGAGGT